MIPYPGKAKEAIETLKERCAKAEKALKTPGGKEVESLQAEVKELQSEIAKKDARITHLEKHKITKSHLADISKIKVRAHAGCFFGVCLESLN